MRKKKKDGTKSKGIESIASLINKYVSHQNIKKRKKFNNLTRPMSAAIEAHYRLGSWLGLGFWGGGPTSGVITYIYTHTTIVYFCFYFTVFKNCVICSYFRWRICRMPLINEAFFAIKSFALISLHLFPGTSFFVTLFSLFFVFLLAQLNERKRRISSNINRAAVWSIQSIHTSS